MNAFNLKPPSFFGDAKPREVLRVLTYHPQQFDASVVSIPTASDPLMRSRTCTVLEKAIGDLDLLPLELINKVLRRSDLRTVSTLRLLNRRARVVVDSSFPYKLILRHAQVVAALEKTGVASHFSVDDVFRALSTSSCGVCVASLELTSGSPSASDAVSSVCGRPPNSCPCQNGTRGILLASPRVD